MLLFSNKSFTNDIFALHNPFDKNEWKILIIEIEKFVTKYIQQILLIFNTKNIQRRIIQKYALMIQKKYIKFIAQNTARMTIMCI